MILRQIFDEIDHRAKKDRGNHAYLEAYRKQVWIILITVSVSLLVIHYMKSNHSFYQALFWIESLFDVPGHRLYKAVQTSLFSELFAYLWWASWHYLFFWLVPVLIVKLVLKDSLQNYGWQLGDTFKHWKIYLVAIVFFILFLSWFSFHSSSFAHYYPFYRLAYRSWFDLFAWEILYLLQFVALEFFFRGFLLQGLRIPLGSISLAVMIVPYVMIHLPKLWPEATGAILFGIFLGILALRSRSIWGGVAIHASVAVTLDISAILQTHGLPKVWFPM